MNASLRLDLALAVRKPVLPPFWYDIAIRTVEWFDQPAPNPGSFAIIGGRGIQEWIELGPNEISFIKSIQIPALLVDNNALWHWAGGDNTLNGITVYYGFNPTAGTIRWGIGLMSSMLGHPRQYCAIENFDPGKPYQQVRGIPYQASGDYSAWTPDKHPEMWGFVPTIYPANNANPDGYLGWTSHNGLIFYQPFFDARTFPRKSSDAALFGGMIATNVFVGPHT